MAPIDPAEIPLEEGMLPDAQAAPVSEEIPIEEPTEEVSPVIPFDEDEIKRAFEDLLRDAREEDREVRDEYVRLWKRLEYYWNNILDIFLDPVSRDWRIPNWDELEDEGEMPPRLINIYRPHGEAICAALSVTIPGVIFHPDDADKPEDLDAAKAYRNLSDLLALHNEAPMLFVRALVILFNQGTIFGYNYYHESDRFGTIKKPIIENKDLNLYEARCPNCGEGLDGGVMNPMMGQQAQPEYQCQNCGYTGPAEVNNTTEKLPQIVGFTDHPKGSICQEIFSGMQVKVPAFVKKQEECGYLLLEFVQSTPLLRDIFENPNISSRHYSAYDDSFSKIPLQYLGDIPDNSSNVSCLWLRPWQFWQLGAGKVEIVQEMKRRYKDGCYAIFINDEFQEAYPEKMDEHWTVSKNPLGQFMYGRPMGENLSTVQDIRAQLVEIELQTAEHGIPETFADGKVLDFQKYGHGRAKPGMMTQVNPRAGKAIGEAFFTTKAAILSQEIDPLRQHIDQDAQFVVGSFPSVYGGPATGGSKTASEYEQSRAIALQRLGTYWKIVAHFWSNFQARSSVEFANVLKETQRDERYTKKEGDSFINVWIRATELQGTIGRTEPEASEQLPSSWAQKKAEIQNLLLSGVPEVLAVLTHPRNAEVMKAAVGLREFYIPGEEDRTRQLKEFNMLKQGVPVPVNMLADEHEIHIEILRGKLESTEGEILPPEIIELCNQHLMEHMQYAMAASQPENESEGGEAEGESQEKQNAE